MSFYFVETLTETWKYTVSAPPPCEGVCVLTHGELGLLYIFGVGHERLIDSILYVGHREGAAALMYLNVLCAALLWDSGDSGMETSFLPTLIGFLVAQ